MLELGQLFFEEKFYGDGAIVWEAIFLGSNYPQGQLSVGQLSRWQ